MLIARTTWLGRLISLTWPVLLFLPMVVGGLLVGYWSGPRLLLYMGASALAGEGLRQVWHARWAFATITLDGERLRLDCLGRHEERNLQDIKTLRPREGLGREIICLDFSDGMRWRIDSWMSQFAGIRERLLERFPEPLAKAAQAAEAKDLEKR